MTTKHKSPLSGFPHAKPHGTEQLEANLKVARERMEGCRAERDRIWRQILDRSQQGRVQEMMTLRFAAEKQNVWALDLEAKIIGWEREIEREQRGGMR